MRLKLAKLQKSDKKTQKVRAKGWDRYKTVNKVLYYQGLSFIFKIIQTKLINLHHNNSLVEPFGINKTRKLIN